MMTPNLSQLETISSTIFSISLEASILILALLLVSWLFEGHLSARLRCSLWVLVWIKLSLPWFPESVTSIYGLWDTKPTADGTINSAEPKNTSSSNTANEDLAVNVDSVVPFFPSDKSATNINALKIGLPDDLSKHVEPIQSSETKEGSFLSLVQIASLAWGLGVIGIGSVMLGNMMTLRRRVEALTYPLPESMSEWFLQCKEIQGVSRQVSLLVTEAVESPAIYRIFRPVILLPKDAMDRYSDEEIRLIWMHELEHLMRRDHWVNIWTSALLALHWFNPFVWYAVKRMRSDREFAVDEAVLRHVGTDAEAYGESILKTMNRVSVQRIQPGLIGILEDKKNLKERFERIANFKIHKKEGKGWWSLIVVALVFGFLCRPVQSVEVNKNGNGDDSSNTGGGKQIESQDPPIQLNPSNLTKADRIKQKLKEIVIKKAHFVNAPFSEVYRWLYSECGFYTDNMEGAYFLVSGSDNGWVEHKSNSIFKQIMVSRISIDPPLFDVSAWDLIQRILDESSMPLKLRVSDFGLMFYYDASKEVLKFETRTYKLPSAEVIVQKAHEILQLNESIELKAHDGLLRVFEAAGLSFIDRSGELSEESKQVIQSLLDPVLDMPSNPSPNAPKPDGRAIFYGPQRSVLSVRATKSELNLVDKIVEALTHIPSSAQVTIGVTSGVLTRSVRKGSGRHVLLRPIGKEVTDESTDPFFANREFFLNPDELNSYLESLNSIQGVELITSPSVTTISLRSASFFVPLEKKGSEAPQFFASRPADMKVLVHPAINQRNGSKLELVLGVNAILPELNRHGQFVIFPDGTQFPELNGGGVISKDHALLIHYSRRKPKGNPWENNKEEWLQEFVILVTPQLIDPAGNPIE